MERNNRKKYIHKDREKDSNEIFVMLDKIESETKSEIENLSEDSDTEYMAEEPIPDNKEESHSSIIWIILGRGLSTVHKAIINPSKNTLYIILAIKKLQFYFYK